MSNKTHVGFVNLKMCQSKNKLHIEMMMFLARSSSSEPEASLQDNLSIYSSHHTGLHVLSVTTICEERCEAPCFRLQLYGKQEASKLQRTVKQEGIKRQEGDDFRR